MLEVPRIRPSKVVTNSIKTKELTLPLLHIVALDSSFSLAAYAEPLPFSLTALFGSIPSPFSLPHRTCLASRLAAAKFLAAERCRPSCAVNVPGMTASDKRGDRVTAIAYGSQINQPMYPALHRGL